MTVLPAAHARTQAHTHKHTHTHKNMHATKGSHTHTHLSESIDHSDRWGLFPEWVCLSPLALYLIAYSHPQSSDSSLSSSSLSLYQISLFLCLSPLSLTLSLSLVLSLYSSLVASLPCVWKSVCQGMFHYNDSSVYNSIKRRTNSTSHSPGRFSLLWTQQLLLSSQ